MARLTLLAVAVVALVAMTMAQAPKPPPVKNAVDALEQYYRARLRQDRGMTSSTSTSRSGSRTGYGSGSTGYDTSRSGSGTSYGSGSSSRSGSNYRGDTGSRSGSSGGQEWDWDFGSSTSSRGGDGRDSWSGFGSDSSRRSSSSGSGSSSTGTSPSSGANMERLNSLVENLQIRLFMDQIKDTSRNYGDMCPQLMDLLERGFMKNWLTSYMQRTRSNAGEWSNEFRGLLRGGRPNENFEAREGGAEYEEREEAEFEPAARQDIVPRSQTGSSRSLNSDSQSPMWQGLMASCYVYQELVHGNAPRLDAAAPRGRVAQASGAQ